MGTDEPERGAYLIESWQDLRVTAISGSDGSGAIKVMTKIGGMLSVGLRRGERKK